MSLFPSAFDAGLASAGSSRVISMASGGKRKRHSVGGDKDDQVRATQVNLAKLMDKVDKGDFKEKDKSGRENLGQMGKKQRRDAPKGGKEKGGAGKQGGKFASNESKPKTDDKKIDKPKPVEATPPPKAKKAKPGAAERKAKAAASGKPQQSKPSASASGSRPAPVELDLPAEKKEKAPTPASADPSLTDMQRRMQSKLEGARFRWINEQLYSTSSEDAVALMVKDPKVFADYHETHRQLTAGWPSPPLPHLISILAPMPKGSVIADLGCGDAGLARALVPQGKVVLSYDLVGDIGGQRSQGSEGWVVPCDFLTGVPLPGRPGPDGGKKKGKKDPAASEIVDAVVCCLSLMGTNWVGGVCEAARILRQGGTFHIAEVTSRFVSTESFVDTITSFGLTLDSQEEPSTHFTLFKFTKKTATPVGPVRGQQGWDERLAEGENILRACVYKKR